ncbi:hypothetical protein, variant [Verruconis gallopava]|uniref:Uncharacterized protein n=1 Tax=Verruconis gallopava TaxID=253628 RepID=A0A0D1YGU8_9PEZI|nr:hypothetical protein, variant [Verruconis gallopava]KIW00002.1 hypothetical protein, variant [Verruconis gallopava]
MSRRLQSLHPAQFFSSSPIGSFYSLRTVDSDDDQREQEPLISSESTSYANTPRTRSPRPHYRTTGPSSHPDAFYKPNSGQKHTGFDAILERFRNSKVVNFIDNFAVENEPGLNSTQLMLTNLDLRPVEPERRQWGAWNYVGFWIADSFNINTWMISSAMITEYGLSWWQSWVCVWIGYTISACFICVMGRIGAIYHIGYPVVARASFGIWGSLWPVFNRAAMACVWYGVQAWLGGHCIKIMISSVWKNYETVSNTNGDPPTREFMAFFLFWLLSLPALWFPVHKIRHLFTIKAYFVPLAGLAYFAWAISKAGGLGPVVHQGSSAKGSDLAWGIVKGIMSGIANFATLIVNNPDFSRFARKPRDAFWSQLVIIPVGFAFTSFIGIIVSSSSAVIYGEAIWNPLDLLERFLNGASSGERFGIFAIASAFALAQLGTNIAANSVSAGTDMTALMPRYLNIRRGSYICAIIGIIICPWNLLKSSNKFTTYLSAYSVFLSSVAGVIFCDYYSVRKGYLQVKDLYSDRKVGPYFYTLGCNWRGYLAYIFGVLINIIGFAGAVGATVPASATYIYNFNYFTGFLVAAGSYWLICRISPIDALSPTGQWFEIGDDSVNACMAYDEESSIDVDGMTESDNTLFGKADESSKAIDVKGVFDVVQAGWRSIEWNRPLIVLHGGPGIGHKYLLSLTDLTTDFGIPVIFYDQIGCGNSTHLREKNGDSGFWSVQLFVDEFHNLVDHLGLASYDVQPKNLNKLIIGNAPASVRDWLEGVVTLKNRLPQDIQDVLDGCEKKQDYESPAYKEECTYFYKLHVCRCEPWPRDLLDAFENLRADQTVFRAMNGPSDLTVKGSLKD